MFKITYMHLIVSNVLKLLKKKKIHNQILNPKMHRYKHYYKCVCMSSMTFCGSSVCKLLTKSKKMNLFCVLGIFFPWGIRRRIEYVFCFFFILVLYWCLKFRYHDNCVSFVSHSQAFDRAKAHRLDRGNAPGDLAVFDEPADVAMDSDEGLAPLPPPTRGRGRGGRGRGGRGRGRGELLCYPSWNCRERTLSAWLSS